MRVLVLSRTGKTHAPIDHIEIVEMFKSTEQLRRIKPTSALIELSLALQVVEQFTTVN